MAAGSKAPPPVQRPARRRGRALDLWGATLALGRDDTFDREAFRKAKNQLIDAGFVLLTKD